MTAPLRSRERPRRAGDTGRETEGEDTTECERRVSGDKKDDADQPSPIMTARSEHQRKTRGRDAVQRR